MQLEGRFALIPAILPREKEWVMTAPEVLRIGDMLHLRRMLVRALRENVYRGHEPILAWLIYGLDGAILRDLY